MSNSFNTSSKSLYKGQSKDTNFHTQKQRVFEALYSQPKTMLMVAFETGILRANVCRHVARLKKQDCIRLIKENICPISKHRAGYYSTNPELFPAIVEPSNSNKHE